MEGFDNLKSIQISIASPEQIRAWSHGAVKKPETINYRTHRPERDGLFCEKIFGPTHDYECFCGKYKSIRYKGIICERCGVEITRSSERRERMAHIELVTPVAHIWYSKGAPNYIALLLDISTRDFEKVLYFNSYIVLEPGNLPLLKKQILSETEYQDYQRKYGDMFKADMGGEAIKYLLKNLDLQKLIDDLKRKLKEGSGSQKQNIIKRLELAETFLNSKSRPEWMILDILPVIPPDLRPMVQLDGGRFATSDLNDLYRRVINRNNRLARLVKLNAPEIIIKNEKRMLQEAVNALIDNGRRGRPVTGPGSRPLKSLNDMLKGKQGRFRQNLLGKRVDYSGRSVIVVGPQLKLNQCGLPQSMALELFKPFIMHKLVDYGMAHNIKSAKRMIEREQDEVWGVLEEVVRDHPVLLNRAPTLHRHGIQGFAPVLVQGKAIQIHPLVCGAFNADFDGDQMAVHVPLLLPARTECRLLLLASNNLLKPANGKAVASPSQDMAIGMFYLTLSRHSGNVQMIPVDKKEAKEGVYTLEELVEAGRFGLSAAENIVDPKGKVIFKKEHPIVSEDIAVLKKAKVKEVPIYEKILLHGPSEAILAYETGRLGLHDNIVCRIKGQLHNTTVGRVIFNQVVPAQLPYQNKVVEKGTIMGLIQQSVLVCGQKRTVQFLDELKDLGFSYATKSGLSISIKDLAIPPKKIDILKTAEKKVDAMIDRKGIEPGEIKQYIVATWIAASEEVTDAMLQNYKDMYEDGVFNSIYMMAISGARGNIDQVKQLSGMRGLMANPHGDIIPVPIKSNFREGLTMTDYFISTYGARKGLVDTALRTADSGYLTRRLVDVAQDSIINIVDCGTSAGMLVTPLRERRTGSNQLVDEIVVPIKTRVYGRKLSQDVKDPQTGEVVVKAGVYADKAIGDKISELEQVVSIDKLTEECMTAEVVFNTETKRVIAGPDIQVTEALINEIKAAGFKKVKVYPRIWVRSAVGCLARDGICQSCYGYDLSTNKPVDIGVAVGVVAAQSIGEPGTQLTMRTFHLGGAIVTQKTGVKAKGDGVVSFDEMNWQMKVARGKHALDTSTEEADKDSDFERNVRRISLAGDLIIRKKTGSIERYTLPVGATLKVKDGAPVRAGDWLAEYNPNEIITGASGTVHYEDILVKDGQVVGRDGKVSIRDGETIVGEYIIPLRGQLKVDEGDAIVAGDVICEVATEDKSAIAGIDGEIEFSNIKIKNQRVISDNGMLYIVPKGEQAEESDIVMPSGMKHYGDTAGVQELPLGPMLRVKNGDQVRKGDQLAAIFSEYDGEIEVQGTKTLLVHSQALREHYMTGNMEIEIDEEAKKLTFVSELAGKAKIISYRSSSNKTVDRRRVIIKDERVYVIPKGAQLSFDNVDVEAGDLVEAGQKITGPIPFVSDLDGTVEVSSRILGELINLTIGGIGASDLEGRVLNESILISKTGEIIGLKGEVICEDLAQTILAEADDIGKISIEQLSETKCIVVTNEDGDFKEYLVPPGATLVVETGDEIKIGEQLIESFAPIEVETGGKINYITEYNKMTGEDLIRKIVVYSGRDYFFPVGIPLVVKNGQVVERGEAITEEVPFESFEKVDRGIKFTSMEEVVKKYHINASMEVNVSEGDHVKIGSQLATINSDRPGVVKVIRALTKTGKIRSVVDRIVVQSGEAHHVVDGAELMCKEGDMVREGDILAKWGGVGQKTTDIIQGLPRVSELFEIRKPKNESLIAALSGKVSIRGNSITITSEEAGGKQFKAQYGLGTLLVQDGEMVEPGVRMTDGNVDPRKLAKLAGVEKVQRYLIDEVQQVYRSQGVNIDDRHIEVIVSNMMTKVQIVKGGDTVFLPGAIVNKFAFLDENATTREGGGRIAEGIPVLQGITKASLTTDSFISAASFQETTRVLTKAAIKSKVDDLRGLKENIIIGKLIPAGTGMWSNRLQWKFSDDQPVQRELTEKEKEEQALLQTLTGDITPTGDGAPVIDPDSVPADLNKAADE